MVGPRTLRSIRLCCCSVEVFKLLSGAFQLMLLALPKVDETLPGAHLKTGQTSCAVATAGVAEEVADAEPRGAAVGVAVSAVAASSVERISAFHWTSLSVKVRAHTSSNLP